MRSLGSAARTVTEFLVLWLVSAVALVLTDLILPGVRLHPTPAGGPFATIPPIEPGTTLALRFKPETVEAVLVRQPSNKGLVVLDATQPKDKEPGALVAAAPPDNVQRIGSFKR